jgi:polysaccharide biosynthesis protein PslG
MLRSTLPVILSIVAVAGCGAAASGGTAGAARPVLIGISDQSPSVFVDPHFSRLGIRTAREVVPWDIVTRQADAPDLAAFRSWLRAAQAANLTPLISFGADFTNPAANYVPTVAQYTRAVKAFLGAFPQLKTFTAWNEPDFVYRSLARHPGLAASYFNALFELCPHCIVLAGDVYLPTAAAVPRSARASFFNGIPPLGPWLRAYIRGVHHRPAGWALHDYIEVRGRNTLQLRTLMSMTSGPIWLDETGGVLRRGHWWFPNQSATAAAGDEQFLLSLTKRYHRIARIYHYEWQGVAGAGWDSGLIAPNGTPRPAYTVLLNWMRH